MDLTSLKQHLEYKLRNYNIAFRLTHNNEKLFVIDTSIETHTVQPIILITNFTDCPYSATIESFVVKTKYPVIINELTNKTNLSCYYSDNLEQIIECNNVKFKINTDYTNHRLYINHEHTNN